MPTTSRILDELVNRFGQNLPPSLQQARNDLEKNLRAALISGFERLSLVTREEFDAQTILLARTRKRLEELESHVRQLEGKGEPTNRD